MLWLQLLHTSVGKAQLDGGSVEVSRQWGQPDDFEKPRGGIACLEAAEQDAQLGSWHKYGGKTMDWASSREGQMLPETSATEGFQLGNRR